MYSILEYMKINKYLSILILIQFIELNSAYYISSSIIDSCNTCNNHYINRNTDRKMAIIKNKCGFINNVTEYIFELCAIIDIMLPKN